MKRMTKLMPVLAFSLVSTTGMAETTRDCMLKGTVQKGGSANEQSVNVKFHSVEKYDQDSTCRVRRGEKMEFKLPVDPRLKEADPGSTVKYRYRTESDGSSQAELISIGT